MTTKKTKFANLERKRGLFFQIALIIILIIALLAFEWSTRDNTQNTNSIVGVEMDVEMIAITPIKKPKPKRQTHQFEIKDDNIELNENEQLDPFVFEEISIEEWLDPLETEEIVEPDITTFGRLAYAEQMPRFPGGEKALIQYIANNINYPVYAQENDIQGKVYVRFLVTKTGHVEDAKIARSIDPLLDNEALMVVETMPKWIPGKQAGRDVDVWFTIPIVFQLLN